MSEPAGSPESQLQKKRRYHHAIVIIVVLVIIGLIILVFGMPAPSINQEDLQPLVISTGSPEYSALLLIADEKGFFRKYGLNVTINAYPTGAGALRDLLSGDSDIACAAEFVGVVLADTSPDLKIIGTSAKSDVISLVVRNDRGITSPKDLKGKIIAVPRGTQAEFYLGRYLELNNIPLSGVTIHDLPPEDLVQGIVSGEVDAVIIWEPYIYSIQQQMGPGVTVWPAQSGQLFYWVSYTRDDVIRDRPDVLVSYFRALSDARDFLVHHNAEAKAIVQQRVDIPDEYIDSVWENTRYTLSLDQSMVIAMEDEARWRIKNNLTDDSRVPNYIGTINTEFLRNVSPESVNIIE